MAQQTLTRQKTRPPAQEAYNRPVARAARPPSIRHALPRRPVSPRFVRPAGVAARCARRVSRSCHNRHGGHGPRRVGRIADRRAPRAARIPGPGARRRRAHRARDGVVAARHPLRRQHERTSARARRARRPCPRTPRDRVGARDAGRRRVSQRRALRVGRVADFTPRPHRRAARRAAEARRRHERAADRPPSRLEVHRVRPGRQALRAHGRAVQYLRRRPRPLCDDRPDECRRQRLRGLRARRAQHRRLRVAPGDARTLVHRQRPRPDGRRPSRRQAQSRAARGPRLRLSVLPRRRRARSAIRARPHVLELRAARAQAGRARRRARHALLYGRHVPARIPRQYLHRRARLVEPQPQGRLSGRARDRVARRPRRARGNVRPRVAAARRKRMGAPPPTCCRYRTARSS